jgi:hypothetical protein
MKVTPHVAQYPSGTHSAVLDAIAQTDGCAVSQQKGKWTEQNLGDVNTVGRTRQVMVRGLNRVDQMFVLTMAAYKLPLCACWDMSACKGGGRRREYPKSFKPATKA